MKLKLRNSSFFGVIGCRFSSGTHNSCVKAYD
jgi:hypothetical protein